MARIGCLLVLLCGLAAAGEDEERFDVGQARCRLSMRSSKWADAGQRYAALLSEHEGREYVRRRLAEIEDDLKLCAFHATYRRPEPAALLGPEVVRFDPGSLRIELKIRGTFTAGLWTKVGKHHVSTLIFEGDLEAVNPPRPFFFCHDPGRWSGYALRWHRDPRARGKRLSLSRLDGGKEHLLGHEDLPGEALRLVRKGSAILLYDRRRDESRATVKLRVEDSRHRSGRIALRKGSCDIRGTVSRDSWRQRVRDHESRAFRAWCASSYDRTKVLPAWLRSDAPAPRTTGPGLPSDAPRARVAALGAAVTDWLDGDPERLEAELKTAIAGSSTGEYLEGLRALGEGRTIEARDRASRVIAREPGFGPAHALRACAHLRLRDGSALARDLAAATKLAPDDPLTVLVEAEAALVAQDVVRADSILQEALGRGVRTARIESMARSIHRSLSGPAWSRRHRSQTPRFVVETDHSFQASRDVAARLDLALGAYGRWFEGRLPSRGKARVRVFATRAGYEAYGTALGTGFAGSAGVYLSSVRELVLLYRPGEASTFDEVIRHEGFHWYVHEIVDGLPIWFNEGHAMCFETAEHPGGPPAPRAPNVRRILELRMVRAAGKLRTARDLMLMDARTFMRGARWHYPQAWALVHLLRTTVDEQLRGTLDRYLAAIRAGRSRQEAFDAVYEPLIRRVEAHYGAHVGKLTSGR